ncbi:telomere stability and silencing-domain-containing protein [Aspergillus undulatus]|uniref:telomere stability and silencing-domain-containing protein n=1 Tax=Aspergillus undulatus TaxID=1810928 RepID=UPI003CCD4552
MASHINVLCSSFPGLSLPSTVSFALPSTSTLSDLCDKVSSYIPPSVPLHSLILTTTNNKQLLPSSRAVSDLLSQDGETTLLPLRLSVPMCGGKGGFGSQLRAAGGRMSSKRKRNQGDDNGSSRNLDGRRLRTVNEAKALAEYLAVKPEMDKKEKEERRRRWEAVVDAAEKRQEEIKNGGGKQKIDGQWMEDKDEMNEKAREAVLAAMKEGTWTDNLKDAILGGSSTSASEGSGQESASASESEEEEVEMKDAPAPAKTSAPRKYIGFDEDDEFMKAALISSLIFFSVLPTLEFPIIMSSSLRRMSPRALSPAWRFPRSYQQPARFFRNQHTATRFLRRTATSGLDSSTTFSKPPLRSLSTDTADSLESSKPDNFILPITCPGCGAYAQTIESNEPGYYGKTRKQTRKLLGEALNESLETPERRDAIAAIENKLSQDEDAPQPRRQARKLEKAADTVGQYLAKSATPIPVCDRCHDLLHHNKAVAAVSPTIHSIGAYLDDSPYRNNHIYHVIDAADFPMSLVDGIYEELSIQEQRSRNRRSATEKYKHGKKLPQISFVITRSDLLAPTKEQVDSKMGYVRSVLREKLGIPSEDYRLGNVYMISSHRGWWTKKVKEEMRKHGGGIWIVGKANAGKSSFVESCLPKDSRNLEKLAELVTRRSEESESAAPPLQDQPELETDGLLPPAPREDLYPVLPVVSSLPGTTVSPIRIPFGRGKGELIDLPGLDRGNLADYVVDDHKRDLIMTKRGKPERYTIKPGQSLLLGGGLVRITPTRPDHVIMAACFLPIEAHLTNTEKAKEMQAEQRTYPGTKMVTPGIGQTISSAGTFDLNWDVTQSHVPISIAKAMERGMKQPSLPYRVMSADILIEGVGWIELTAQIRAKAVQAQPQESPSLPQVEVFTPDGKYIGFRRPIECWQFTQQKNAADRRKHGARGRQNVGHLKRTQHGA